MKPVFATSHLTGLFGVCDRADCAPPTSLPASSRSPSLARRRLGRLATGLAAVLLPASAFAAGPVAGEPTNGCMLAAINERAVLRAKNYLHPDVEAHLLAVMFHDSNHVALVVKGDHRWFAWDDAYGGRPLFYTNASQLPNPITAARAAFPCQRVELAWWADEAGHGGTPRVSHMSGLTRHRIASERHHD